MKIHRFKRCQLSNSNIFDQNFMKLGHIVKYHAVFFKFNNGPYPTMLSVVMALCLWKFTILNDVRSLSRIFFIRILWKYGDVFFKFDNGPYRTMLSAIMALCLWKFTVLNDVRSLSQIVLIRILWNFVTLLSTMMSSSSLIMVYMTPCFKELLPLVYEKSSVKTTSAL